jgi:hypothetical protein
MDAGLVASDVLGDVFAGLLFDVGVRVRVAAWWDAGTSTTPVTSVPLALPSAGPPLIEASPKA